MITIDINKFKEKFATGFYFGSWNIDQGGVWRETNNPKAPIQIASSTPIAPTRILHNTSTGVEKVELTYLLRGRSKTIIVGRSVISQDSKIIQPLSDVGIGVTTDNKNALVKYLNSVINNSDIPYVEAASSLGWADGFNKFLPYDDDIPLDNSDFPDMCSAVAEKGDIASWAEYVAPFRDNLAFRMCMAASFASPLVELLGINPFVFHLWGGTESGKTVALKVAMSIWGNPTEGKLLRSMNMTKNAMIATSAFLKNLPFAGDELQTIKLSNRDLNYDSLIMQLTEGIERSRLGSDSKSLPVRSWRCAFLFTGEETCTKSSSGGGAKNRVIEWECQTKLIPEGDIGRQIANFVQRNYGTCGPLYIKALQSFGEKDINDMYQDAVKLLLQYDTTEKQASAMAAMYVADYIANSQFWPDRKWIDIKDVADFVKSSTEVDVSERAFKYLLGEIAVHSDKFIGKAYEAWGRKTEDGLYMEIIENAMYKILSNQGYDFSAVEAKWRKKGYLGYKDENGRKRYKLRSTIEGVPANVYRIRLLDEE